MTKKKHAPAVRANGHYVGAKTQNGFDVVDGEFFLSPGNGRRMEQVLVEEASLLMLQRAILNHITERLKITRTQSLEWWKDMKEDLLLNPKQPYLYDNIRNCIYAKDRK